MLKLSRSLQIALTYMGAIIGAGFASGQEILQFFVLYDTAGLVGIILSGLLFIILGISIVLISYNLEVSSYQSLFYSIGGKRVGLLADLILTLFLAGSLIVMLAGSQEIFGQIFKLNLNLGFILTLIIIIITNYYGLNGIMNLNLILIPSLIFIVFFVINNLVSDLTFKLELDFKSIDWILSSFTYTGYNLILGLTVLLPLTIKARKDELSSGVAIGGLLLGLMAFFIGYTLNSSYNEIVGSEIPMLRLILNYQVKLYYLYAITLWIAMLTTASCNLYALTGRLIDVFNWSREKTLILIFFLLFLFINLSFSYLVELIYSKLGKLSLGLLSIFIIKYFWYEIID